MQVARVPPSTGNRPEADYLVPPFRNEAAETSDHDAEAAEVRKARQHVGHGQAAPGVQRIRRNVRHVEQRDQLVQDGLVPISEPATSACDEGIPKSQTTGDMTIPRIR
jgi:fructose-bisphosphate aldolase class 1